MICYRCGEKLTESDYCQGCGEYVGVYKKVMSLSNYFYNEGLEKAKVRDLSGAKVSLQQSLKLNKNNIDARNLLGLIYFETGEVVAALCEWVISKNLSIEDNRADFYMNELRSNPGRLDMLNQTVKKYNVALHYCQKGNFDVAVIQLKKILSNNSRFLAAHQLLGLVYMNDGRYSKAEKELEKAYRIDTGSTRTKYYLQECRKMMSPGEGEDTVVTKVKASGESVEYKVGNEMIIQPVHHLQPKGTVSFISIIVGGLLGCLAALFLFVPAKIEKVNNQNRIRIATISEQADAKSAQLNEAETEKKKLQVKIDSMNNTIESYAQTDETVNAMNELMAAVSTYTANRSDIAGIASHMDKINMEKIDKTASDEFKTLYNSMMDLVGPKLGSYYYKSGYSAYASHNYKEAIADLKKSSKYEPTNEAAFYFLASSYYESGDKENAKKTYGKVIDKFPKTRYANKAETRLAEINNEN
ncbi:tetratricopeptide repeat protein [Butyrivibrio sp. NC3005]|uniref:tetratricopeptide repeat protein n=1 Tax=Butyrivibrio sp. NC3005 TaxID=1280685 RepID=UPI0003F6F66C|nr:tetratricopeptide repeat protein [Butyrivibrio sp. NC3005]